MNALLAVGSVLLQLLFLMLFADFVSGCFHWLEDAYRHVGVPVVIRPNIVHHHHPRWFLRRNWWQSSWDLLALALHRLMRQAWVFAALTVNANQFHKWAHRSRAENGRVISLLHDLRLFQTLRHHAQHHANLKKRACCVVNNWLNPVLDRLRFWARLEGIVRKVTGLRRRADTSVSGQGPAPEWLARYASH